MNSINFWPFSLHHNDILWYISHYITVLCLIPATFLEDFLTKNHFNLCSFRQIYFTTGIPISLTIYFSSLLLLNDFWGGGWGGRLSKATNQSFNQNKHCLLNWSFYILVYWWNTVSKSFTLTLTLDSGQLPHLILRLSISPWPWTQVSYFSSTFDSGKLPHLNIWLRSATTP